MHLRLFSVQTFYLALILVMSTLFTLITFDLIFDDSDSVSSVINILMLLSVLMPMPVPSFSNECAANTSILTNIHIQQLVFIFESTDTWIPECSIATIIGSNFLGNPANKRDPIHSSSMLKPVLHNFFPVSSID